MSFASSLFLLSLQKSKNFYHVCKNQIFLVIFISDRCYDEISKEEALSKIPRNTIKFL